MRFEVLAWVRDQLFELASEDDEEGGEAEDGDDDLDNWATEENKLAIRQYRENFPTLPHSIRQLLKALPPTWSVAVWRRSRGFSGRPVRVLRQINKDIEGMMKICWLTLFQHVNLPSPLLRSGQAQQLDAGFLSLRI